MGEHIDAGCELFLSHFLIHSTNSNELFDTLSDLYDISELMLQGKPFVGDSNNVHVVLSIGLNIIEWITVFVAFKAA